MAFNLCDKVVELYPEVTYCRRPTRNKKTTRCDQHPIKRLWPGDNDAMDK